MSNQSNNNTAAFETPPTQRRTQPSSPRSNLQSPPRPRRRSFNRPIQPPPRISGTSSGRVHVQPIRPTPRRGQLWPTNAIPPVSTVVTRTNLRLPGTSSVHSPPRKPRPINRTKYENMLKRITKKARINNRNARKNDTNNLVSSWTNESGIKAGKGNIPRNRRVFLMPDVNRMGDIKHVYDRKFISGMIESFEVGFNTIFPNDEKFFTSPATRRKFSKKDIKAYPPTPNTRRLIRNRNRL